MPPATLIYPEVEPHESGMLAVGEGNRIYWEVAGDPSGKPALVLHGGPGSGSGPWWRRLFDPELYRLILLDQRASGRSVPNAGDPTTDLESNTTAHLLDDIESLRTHLGIPRWLVLGGSWGSTLALAYAEKHRDRASELILFSVTTTSSREVEWVTRGIGRLLPGPWARFRDFLPPSEREGNLAAAYARLLADPDSSIRERAAYEWCRWDDAQTRAGTDRPPDPRFEDARFRLCFSRLVTHYWANAGFLPDGALLAGAGALAGIPGAIVHGGNDLGCPLDVPRDLSRVWADADLVVIDGAGHGSSAPMTDALIVATDRFGESRA
jgi:proline iminopeptidase